MPSEEEGFPHVLLEAMAAGLPYVASDVGAVREITPPSLQEYIVAHGDTAMFAKKIVESLEKPEAEKAKVRDEQLERVKKYDIQKALSEFLELFGNPKS